METNFIEEVKIKPRKDSTSSNSTCSSTSLEEKKYLIDKFEKIEIDPDAKSSEFEIIITENEKNDEEEEIGEVEKVGKTCSQKFFECFKCKSNKKLNKEQIKDEDRTIEEIINSKGFKCEKHEVKTEDGYILTLFRIPGDKKCDDGSKLPPVLLQHGVFDSSDGWVCNGENHSIAFVLANNNFDVWLSNSRGNKYCKRHDKFQENSYEFWQFSFHHLGIYDVPSIIKYIREVNKSGQKIIYFGHSQGATLMFSGLIENSLFYKENIKLFVALAPVTKINNIGSSLLNFICNISLHKIMMRRKIYEICPYTKGTHKFISFINRYANCLTNYFIGLLSDSNSKKYNDQNSLSVYLKHYPCGTSLNCLIHYIQIIKAKKFIHFDYGKDKNIQIYNQEEPPEYDLSKIKDIPIMIISGENDKLATPKDVRWLYNELKTNVLYFNIVPNMGHLSFMVGNNFSWFNEPLDIIKEDFYK